MAINWIESKVIDQIKWTNDLVSIKFENKIPPYTAGQFTKIGLKIDGELVSRPYSLVSSPKEDFLEVIYVNVPDGKLTPKLHALKKDDVIYVMDKPSGFFIMDEVPDGDKLWLIATGTGLGVFISLLKTDSPWKRFKEIILIHGVRTAGELAYQDQIEQFKEQHPDQLKYIQTVTREFNQKYYDVIEAFYRLTGIPMLLNTSFNCQEPIVETPQDAINTFKKCGLGVLVIDDYIVRK